MLHDRIDKNISGILTIWDIHCTFSLSDGSILEIRPIESETDLFQNKCKERNGNYDSLDWIHGQSYRGYDLAFMPTEEQGPFCYYRGSLTLSVAIVLQALNSKGTDGKYLYAYEDLCGFNTIDFAGKAVVAVFHPKTAIKKNCIDDNRIEWLSCKEYAKVYDTTVQGIACKLIFTIVTDRQDIRFENTSLGTMHSVIRLAFLERQSISMIEPCWQAVCTFLTFCIGQFNVTNLDVGLWDKETAPGILDFFGDITCVVNNDKTEDLVSIYPAYYRFTISSLGEKTGELFQLLNDADCRPILGFLPKTNTDFEIDRNKIRELCTAFEVEYAYRMDDLSEPWIKDLVGKLKETAKQFREDNPDTIDDNEYSYITSTIGFIDKPARRKIACIYNRYQEFINKHLSHFLLSQNGFQLDTSEEATAKDIAWIVKTRNRITHSTGNTDNIIPNAIYARLKIALFCSVFERAGYSIDEIGTIIDCYFSGNLT